MLPTSRLTRLLLGRRLANSEAEGRKIGVFAGLPAMGLDGLSSAAYGPEATMSMLVALGAAGLGFVEPITWLVLALLFTLYLSYRQTLAAYPNNGGSYTVARENLGANTGLLAATALMVDYVLNVAVGISAGIGALISAVPSLQEHTVALCLGVLALITLVNLRGTRDSGFAFALPTYLFLGSLGLVLILGVMKMTAAGGAPAPVIAPPAIAAGTGAATLWLLLRAFASGCTAMTGVEAVSNGVSAFKAPSVRRARLTLLAIVGLLAFLLAGVAHVARGYGIAAMDQTQDGYQSVLSQIALAVVGRGWLYYITIASVLAVLCLSANTSFVDFPRLCRIVAQDGYLPRAFAVPGRRLVCSVGILFLSAGAGLLLVGFGGITDALIPLFAIGAFLAFTLSQAGMAVHWWRAAATLPGRRRKLLVNGFGAVTVAITLAVILVAKFAEGAWLTVAIIPATLLLLQAIGRYYRAMDRRMQDNRARAIQVRRLGSFVVLVPLERWDRLARKAIEYAMRLSPDVVALHLTALEGPDNNDCNNRLIESWHRNVELPAREAGRPAPRLLTADSDYRSVVGPLLRSLRDLQRENPGRPVAVVLPELVEGNWWAYLLHIHHARTLRRCLLRFGGGNVAVLSVPWQVQPLGIHGLIAAEEPVPAAA